MGTIAHADPAPAVSRPRAPRFTALAVAPLLLSACVALAAPRALVGGLLIDGNGGAPVPDSVVLIDGERIVAAGSRESVAIPDDAERIPAGGLTVLPGLWDLGVHVSRLGHADRARWDEAYLPLAERVVVPLAARQLLLAGVTSARDLATPLAAAVAARERIAAARIPGPRLFVSGPTLEKDPPAAAAAYRWAVSGAAAARDAALRLVHAGVDFIVVAGAADFGAAELAAVDRVATEAGIGWQAEVRHDADIAPALKAGAAGLIGFGTDLAPALPESALAALRSRAAAGAPVPWTTGLAALTNYEWLLRNPTPLDDPRWRDGLPGIVADDIRDSLRHLEALRPYETPALRSAVLAGRLASARAAGARLLVGSDAGLPGQLGSAATWQEVELLVLAGGLSPMEAIRAATLDAASVMRAAADSGSITPGKYADLIAVRGDPLRHIERLQDVEIVIRHGLRYR
jgi:imidazolonepropionase-like amidohydrolase